MISDLVATLEPSLTNAHSLSSLVDKMPESDQVLATSWINEVLATIDPYALSDKDKITFLKLYLRFCKSKSVISLEDLLPPNFQAHDP